MSQSQHSAPVRIALVGVGNCASSLVQGLHYYRDQPPESAQGLMHWDIGGYRPFDVEVVAAFDIDRRKVGQPLSEAVFAPPNCTRVFCPDLPPSPVRVSMGPVLDGYSEHMALYPEARTFQRAGELEPEAEQIITELKNSGTEVVLNYLPVGSENATRFYAECALEAGAAFVNNIPVFIASDPVWQKRFQEKGLPLIGDDIKSQLGATIVHRTLTELFDKRGIRLDHTYQLNTGGNTDFLNMLNRDRLASKKKSKTEAVKSSSRQPLTDENLHVGPSDYVAWQKDNKVCFIRMEGTQFGGIPLELELRLSVEDSPNSAGVAIDALRLAKLARDQKLGGPLLAACAAFCKHPPQTMSEEEAYRETALLIEKLASKKQDSL